MSVRQVGKNPVSIPADAIQLEFPRSDGDKSQWPGSTKKIVDKDGSVNYMASQGLDEGPCPSWRKNSGMAVAKALDMDGASTGRVYVLKGWPPGYQMYLHHKGPANRPRTDPYLYGSTQVLKFRSSNEFAPHAIWLFTDPTLTHSNCQCKYSTKKSQLSISQSMGLSARAQGDSPPATSSAGPRPSQGTRTRPKRETRPPNRNMTKPYTAVRPVPKPVKRTSGPKTVVLPERNNDIRDSLILSEVMPPRMYRPGEVIWCRLERPIWGPAAGRDSIFYWPGIVDDTNLKIVPKPLPGAGDAAMEDVHSDGATHSDANTGARPIRREAIVKPDVRWGVEQHYVYKVKLLATTHSCQITDTGALPYLAYALPPELLDHCFLKLNEAIRTVDTEDTENHLKKSSDFNPFDNDNEGNGASSTSSPQQYQQAVVPYSLAVEIAKNITCFWAPTDQWDYTFAVPPLPPAEGDPASSPPVRNSQNYSFQSLHSAITAAMANNAGQSTPATTPTPSGHHVTGASGELREGLKETAANLMGSNIAEMMAQATNGPLRTVVQSRYQGLWWGAERIWVDELVRLKLSRNQFAPAGAPAVFPPSGMSASTAAAVEQQNPKIDVPLEAYGAGERGLFMKIEGLFVVDIPSLNGTIKECRASGMLYELADADWEAEGAPPIDEKGKGKAKSTDDMPLDPAVGALPSASQPNTPERPVPGPSQGGPSSSTSAQAVEEVDPQGNRSAASSQISPPVRVRFEIPTAPTGFKFRPILPPGHEVVLSLSLISGRYYPGILNHPLLHDTVREALQAPAEALEDANYLWALQGTVAGIYQSMDPQYWKVDRHAMLTEADQEARTNFVSQWRLLKEGKSGVNGAETSQMPSGSRNGMVAVDEDVKMEDMTSGGGSASGISPAQTAAIPAVDV